jgi:hypothetical protein
MTIAEILLALLLPPLLLVAWVGVQAAWRRQFGIRGDALAARGDCGQCGCIQPCDRRKSIREA